MNITPRRFLKTAALFGASFCLATFPLLMQAESVVKETFDAPLSPDQWKVIPPDAANAAEGALTLNSSGPEGKYAVVLVRSAQPLDRLNFVKNTVAITLSELDLKGSASPEIQIFQLIMGSDTADDQPSSMFQLRIAAAGSLILSIQDKGASSPVLKYMGSVTLPVKNLKVVLNASQAILSIEDASGKSEQTLPFTSAPTAWATSAPYIRIQSQRNPGPGDLRVTLHGLSVDSTVAAPAKK